MPTPAELHPKEPPFTDPIVEAGGLVTFRWLEWFLGWSERVDDTAEQLQEVTHSGFSAAIATTPIPTDALPTGDYRVTFFARIQVPASVSSSLTITLGFTDGGVAQSITFAAITGNLTTSWQSETKTVHIDGASPITYAVAYSSIGTPMQFRLDVLLEQL